MLLNGSSLNSTGLNNTAGSGMINAEGSTLAAFVVSAFITVTQPALANSAIELQAAASAVRNLYASAHDVSATSTVAGAGVRYAFADAPSSVLINATASADVVRYMRGEAQADLTLSGAPTLTRYMFADAQVTTTADGVAARAVYAEGSAEVENITASTGMRNALAVGRADLALTADNSGTITYSYPSVSANVELTATAAVSVKMPASGDAHLALDAYNSAVSGTFKPSGESIFTLRPSGFASVTRTVNTPAVSTVGINVSGRASNTIFTTASAFVNFQPTAAATIPSYIKFDIPLDVHATRIQQPKGESDLTSLVASAVAVVDRGLRGSASVVPDVYGSAATRLPSGGFKQDAYADARVVFNTATDDSLVLRYTGGLSVFAFNASAYARQRMFVKGAASTTVFTASGRPVIRRNVIANAMATSLTVTGRAVRVAKAVGDTDVFCMSHAIPRKTRTAYASASTAFNVTGFGKYAEKATGSTALALTVSAFARHIQNAYASSNAEAIPINASATRICMANGDATLSLRRVDATALSNLTMPAPDERSFTIESVSRSIDVPEQNRTFDA